MNPTLLSALAGSVVRWGLGILGTLAVAHGVFTSDDVSVISPQIQEALGSLVSAAALGWSAYQKHKSEQTTAAKEIVAAETKTTTADRAGEDVSPAVEAKAAAIKSAT